MGYLSDRLAPNSVWAQALNRPLSGAQRMALENRLGPMQQNMLPQQNMAPQTPQDDILLAAALGMHNRPPSGPVRRMTADDTRPGLRTQPTLVPATDNPLANRIGEWAAENLRENERNETHDAVREQLGFPPAPDPFPVEDIVTNAAALLPLMSLDEIQYGNSGGMDVFNTALGAADVFGFGALAKPLARAGANITRDFINKPSVAGFLADERGSLMGTGGGPSGRRMGDNGGPQLDPEMAAQVEAQIANYPAAEGWSQNLIEVAKVKEGKPVYRKVAYGFETPPDGVSPAAWQSTMVDRSVEDVRTLVDRVRAGDPAAIEILQQANWYRTMRVTLREEFGGMGDTFADVLGATSAQTGVEANWNNAIEVMRRYSRGEYDQELRMYQEMLDAGDVNPTTLQQLHSSDDSPFRLITSAGGALFNINSPAATKALFNMFRTAKGAPKTPNFTGNLIGYVNDATIDVWAARNLRRLSGQDRLPPMVEKAVTGRHRKKSTIYEPNVGGEFGFGQRVFADAADRINEEGIIRSVAPDLEDLSPADLQAVAWFIEKERWTKGGWTSKAGEGGSFDFEASIAGAADPAMVVALRQQARKNFKPPNRHVKDTDESYAARVEAARVEQDALRGQAQAALDEMQAPLARYVLGISVERPGLRPSNSLQAQTSELLGEPAINDPSVAMYQVTNSYGYFMGKAERAFNAEFIVRQNFDPSPVTRRMVEVARDADQDAAFISKVVPNATPDSRPGVEIYFRDRQGADFARELSDRLTEHGVDGFTFITDSRVMDRAGAQANMAEEAVAGLNGLRFQYIPEFDIGRDAWLAMKPAERAAKLDEMRALYADVAGGIDDASVSAVNMMEYETNVIERGDYDAYLE